MPTFADPVGDAGGDPGQDITGVAIAPLDTELLIRIDTAGPPPMTGRAFWILFDFIGQQHFEVKISFTLEFTEDLDVFPEGVAPPPRVGWEGATVAVGSVVEARFPYASGTSVRESLSLDALFAALAGFGAMRVSKR